MDCESATFIEFTFDANGSIVRLNNTPGYR